MFFPKHFSDLLDKLVYSPRQQLAQQFVELKLDYVSQVWCTRTDKKLEDEVRKYAEKKMKQAL